MKDTLLETVTHQAGQKQSDLEPISTVEIDPNAYASADEALDRLSGEFAQWMAAEVASLQKARDYAKATSFSDPSAAKLYSVAHDIKGQAKTLGYPLAGMVCTSLTLLLESYEDKTRIPFEIIDQHVEMVEIFVRDNIHERDNPLAIPLIQALQKVIADFAFEQKKQFITANRAKVAANH